MSDDSTSGREVARLFRQRAEMGGTDLFLDGLTRVEALELARAAKEGSRGLRTGPDPSRPAVSAGGADPRAPSSRRAPAPQAVGAQAPGKAAIALPVLPDTYAALEAEALACTRCRLADTRTRVVFSDGAVNARLVVVGEAPGANEDATGLPFVGAAGQFLDLLLATVGLSRQESVYICNVLKCRPPGNRNPQSDEIEACSPFLRKQLELIAPQALLAVGTFAGQALTGEQKPLGRLRGSVHAYQGVPLVVTYHPAALLRNAGWTRAFWDDLQLLRSVMDGA